LSDHYLTDVDLAAEIYDIHVASRRTYGAPRVAGQLANRGRRHSRKRVARIMAECGLVGVHGRKKWRRGKANPAPAPDLLQRDFTAEASNQRWVADITEFRCWDGKLYLAGIFDLHDHAIVGWSMAQRQTTDLVVNALVMALGRRIPDGDLLHHADRGKDALPDQASILAVPLSSVVETFVRPSSSGLLSAMASTAMSAAPRSQSHAMPAVRTLPGLAAAAAVSPTRTSW
jgi:transposase InsO family protein